MNNLKAGFGRANINTPMGIQVREYYQERLIDGNNGAQGDINHVNVHPKGGDLNGMFMDFDDVSRGL